MMYMKMRFLWIALVLVFVGACSQKGKIAIIREMPEIPAEWHYLEKEEFSVRYPQGWEVREDLEGVVFYLLSAQMSPSDSFRENVNLVVEELTAPVSLDKYASLSLRGIKGKYKIADEKKYIVDGQKYYYLMLKEKENLYLEQHYFIKDKKAYILTFTYEPKEQEQIRAEGDKIMKSFRIK